MGFFCEKFRVSVSCFVGKYQGLLLWNVLIWADRHARLRNTLFGLLAFVIFLLLRVGL